MKKIFASMLVLSLSLNVFAIGWEDAEEAVEVFTFDTLEGEHGIAAPGGGSGKDKIKPSLNLSYKQALEKLSNDPKAPAAAKSKARAQLSKIKAQEASKVKRK